MRNVDMAEARMDGIIHIGLLATTIGLLRQHKHISRVPEVVLRLRAIECRNNAELIPSHRPQHLEFGRSMGP